MKRKAVTVVFDRLNQVDEKGVGKVEIVVRLSRTAKKNIQIATMTTKEWEKEKNKPYILAEIERYQKIVDAMETFGEEMTVVNFNAHIGITGKAYQKKVKEEEDKEENTLSFLDFMRDNIATAKIRESTRSQKLVSLKALMEYGKIESFADVTVQNIREFDKWLRKDGIRSDVCINNYHKNLKLQTRKACQEGLIDKDPYELIKFPRGKCKERRPLNETELKKMREMKLPEREARIRDLFIFAAYTGLAFCDTQDFDFRTMTEQIGDLYYIDGSRLKTGTNFFTPILPPAMEVLKKYNFKLPKISNQKANDILHMIEVRMGLNKPVTFHVARHSFATLSLSHDIPIEKVARMLGHKDIKTTQIYAKVLKSTIANHASDLSKVIL
ncbi:MAG: site-specific integrase [Bacteroidaceae bacterium]|nr:site-specific integrase [Bacteroidaceae bacterium]